MSDGLPLDFFGYATGIAKLERLDRANQQKAKA
jgi:hypothetical protein